MTKFVWLYLRLTAYLPSTNNTVFKVLGSQFPPINLGFYQHIKLLCRQQIEKYQRSEDSLK